MIGLHAAGITDVGRQRSGNEDALHVGDSVFAVADGMGGHAAGEIASALALEPIATLDGRVFGEVEEAQDALVDAVVEANRAVVQAAEDDHDLQGMGTTLTAALFEGRRLHVAHVGDSRAYLLRDGKVVQLTRDHTFVQQLLDDGRITQAEAATHPHRSVITRAIGAQAEVEVDLQSIDLEHRDAVLLCSDGLSGVVDETRIGHLLSSGEDPAETVVSLVDAANDAGGPDNITAVLLTVIDRDVTDDEPFVAPAPQDEPTASLTDDGEVIEHTDETRRLVIRPDTDAAAMRPLPGPGPDESLVVDPAVRRRRIASVVVAVATVLGLMLGGGRWLLSRSYYVGLDEQRDVVVYQGIPAQLGPVQLSWVFEETGLDADQLPQDQVFRLEEGIAAVDSSDARDLVAGLREVAAVEAAEDEASGDGATDAPSDTDADATGADDPSPDPSASP